MSKTSRRSILALAAAGPAVAVAGAARAAPAPRARSTQTRPGEGRVALITGSSRGIGAATAKRLAAEGYAITVNYLTSRDLAEQVARDIEAGGGRAIVRQGDVADPGAVAALFDANDQAFGGVDVVLDMVGAAYAELNLNALKPGGRWVVIATLTGALAQIDLMRVMLKRVVLTGSTLRSRPADEKARLAAAVEKSVWPWVASGAIKVKVEATFPLERTTAAHQRLEAGDHVGKIVLTL